MESARSTILETTIQLAEQGPLLSLQRIAEEAEVTPSAIYRLFCSKEHVLEQIVKIGFASHLDPSKLLGILLDRPDGKSLAALIRNAVNQWYDDTPKYAVQMLIREDLWGWKNATSPEAVLKALAVAIETELFWRHEPKPDSELAVRIFLRSLSRVEMFGVKLRGHSSL